VRLDPGGWTPGVFGVDSAALKVLAIVIVHFLHELDVTGLGSTEFIESSQDFTASRGQAGTGNTACGAIDFDQFLVLKSRYFVPDGFEMIGGPLYQEQG
jgi:hypothetical protein